MDAAGSNHLVTEAHRELSQKNRQHIEEETAWKWAARAIAAYRNFATSREHRWLRDSEAYLLEAVEHAAVADESGELLREVRAWMRAYIPPGVL